MAKTAFIVQFMNAIHRHNRLHFLTSHSIISHMTT